MLAEIMASIGLLMDIGGIYLLFRFGAIGGDWIAKATTVEAVYEERPGDAERAQAVTDANRGYARWGALLGLYLTTGGFGLQLVAQWL